MESFWLVLSLGVVALPIVIGLRSLQRVPAAGMWAVAWTLLWIGGMSAELSIRYPALLILDDVAGPLFATLMLAGALAFTERRRPRWLWAAAVGIVGTRLVATLGGSAELSVAVGSVLEGPLILAAALLLWRSRPESPAKSAERVVAGSLLGLVILGALGWIGWPSGPGAGALLLGAWIGVALLGCVFQLVSILERTRERERRRAEERGVLRRLAGVMARAHDSYSALAEASRELQGLGLFAGFGIYLPDATGESYALLEDPSPPVDPPEGLRRVWRNDAAVQRAMDSTTPVFLEPLPSDDRIGSELRSLGSERAVVAALHYGGEVLGLMVAGLAGAQRLDAEVRRFVQELAEELSLILAALRVQQRVLEHARSLESERLTLQALVEAAPVGILLADGGGRIRLVNRLAAHHLGVDRPEAWLGRPAQDVLFAARAHLQAHFGEQAIAALETASSDPNARIDALELHTQRPEGERVLLVDARPVHGARGQRIGRVWTTLDVTAERHVTEALSHAQRMETLGALAGGLAHDFNNQLTAILGNARLLLDDLSEDDPHRASVVDLERAAEHCTDLTRGLLTIARPAPASRRPVDLGRMLSELEALLHASLGHDVRLEVSVAPDLPPLDADESQLRRVLTNLVVNGRDAVAAAGGGCVRVTARAGKLLARDGSPAVEICVEDDGLGMDQEIRRRIFDPFFTTKPKGAGTGLGLAVVYRVVEAHGGEIAVESAPGKGTVFRLLWPISSVAGGSADSGSDKGSPPPGETVLLADDEPAVRRLARLALERAGFRVLEAEDGESAVRLFRDHGREVALLIVDWFMPRKNGLEALREIRGLAPEIPAILISGQLRDDGLPAPGSHIGFLSKPFDPRSLVNRVSEELGRSAGH